MSTPGNTAKPGTAHSNIQTAQRGPSLVGSEPAMHYSAYYRVSILPTMPARHENKYNIIFTKSLENSFSGYHNSFQFIVAHFSSYIDTDNLWQEKL